MTLMVDLRINETRQIPMRGETISTVLPFGRRCFQLRRFNCGDYSVRLKTAPTGLE